VAVVYFYPATSRRFRGTTWSIFTRRVHLSAIFASRPGIRRKESMNRSVVNLIAAAERNERGYADVPPGSINDEIESELALFGYAVALSDRLWIGGTESIRLKPSNLGTIGHTCRRQSSPARHPALHMFPMPATSTWKLSSKSVERSARTDNVCDLDFVPPSEDRESF
jgi:hypothetical protein